MNVVREAAPGCAAGRRGRGHWAVAVGGAVLLNLALFAVMPGLRQQVGPVTDTGPPLSRINVVRLKRPDTPAQRTSSQPPVPPPALRQPPVSAPPAPAFAPRLSFAVNPRLPRMSDTVALPVITPAGSAAAVLGSAFGVEDLDSGLNLLVRVPPVYPVSAKHRGIEGWVRVRLEVEEDGRVGSVRVLESAPAGVFDQSVVRCVSGWRFQPGTVDGTPVKAWAETTVRFQLK